MPRNKARTTVQFSDKLIAGLKPRAARYYIREARGFAIRVQPSGLKTWFFIYTIKGIRKHLNLGAYPGVTLARARVLYTAAYNLASQSIDPHPDKAEDSSSADDMSFGHFTKLYLVWSDQHHNTAWNKTLRCALSNDVLPYWDSLAIQDISRRDAIGLLERVALRAPGMVTNVKKAISGVLDYALQRDYLELNVTFRLAKVVPALKRTVRDRVLSDTEVKQVWTSISEGPGDDVTKRALKLVLVTAQRPGEVTGMHRREITGSTWTIPKERMKTGLGEHIVHLSATALALIGDSKGYSFLHTSQVRPYFRLPCRT
jgi:hypothetical protein